jgi:hypothetical protein
MRLKLHPTKTDFQGKHALDLLGIMVDTRRQLYLLSPLKFAKISQAARLFRLKAIRPKRRCSLRDIQRVCGLGNSVCRSVTDDRLHLRILFDCASAATSSRRVTLYHQSLRDLAWWGDLPTNVYVGCGIWDASPSATLVTDASMEGWGAVLHAQPMGNENTPSCLAPPTRAGVHQRLGTSVPAPRLSYPRMRSPPPSTNGSCSPRYWDSRCSFPLHAGSGSSCFRTPRWLWPSSGIRPAGRRGLWPSFGSCSDFARKTGFRKQLDMLFGCHR